MFRNTMLAALCAVGMALAPAAAQAQTDWPTGAVTLVAPFAAGGSTDLAARALAQGLSEIWKQPVVVENRPGGATLIGVQHTLSQPADGNTLYVFPTSHTISPGVRTSLPYDTLKDFTYAGMFMDAPMAIFSSKEFPANTLPELIEEAKKHEDAPLRFGSPGIATAGHMGGALLQSLTGIKLQHVSYTGSSTALPDLLSNRIPLLIVPLTGVTQYVDDGSLKLIAVLGADRATAYPDVPTASETIPGLVVRAFCGIALRAGTPQEIVDKIAADMQTVVTSPAYIEASKNGGYIPWTLAPAETTELIQSEISQWKTIADQQNIHVQ